MPSCVVKHCRNRSDANKKREGITFHRFPTNELWRTDWVEIIRKCKNDNNWKPSRTSVICSEHFAPNDIYKTKGGLLRIVTYAVPRQLLKLEKRRQRQKQNTVITINANLKQEVKPIIARRIKAQKPDDDDDDASNDADQGLSDNEDEEEIPTPTNVASSSQQSSPDELIECKPKTRNIKKDVASSSNQDQQENVTVTPDLFGYPSNQVYDPLTIVVKEERPDVAIDTQGEYDNTDHEDSPNGFNSSLDALLADLAPLRKRRVKEHLLNVQNTIKGQRAKIKLLNQRIRRLEIRNKTLKTILKKVTVIRKEKTGVKLPKGIYQTE